jgi:putative membrane protein
MTNANTDQTVKNIAGWKSLLWMLMLIYAGSRLLQVFPSGIPMLAIVILHVIPPAVFALIHGAMFYRIRGILAFVAICLLVGNVFENLGVRTGFPFGHYYFTDVMGPKILVVPVFLGLAYVGMAYLSWTLARLILEETKGPLTGSRVVTLALLASAIMVSWDLSMDSVWSTIVRAWIWQQGGIYFGVPLTNFLGWFVTGYVFYQLFALYLRNRGSAGNALPADYWNMAVAFYAISAAGNLLLLIPQPGPAVVSDPSGVQWKVSSITAASAVATISTMGAFALLAWIKRPGAGRGSKATRQSGLGAKEIALG